MLFYWIQNLVLKVKMSTSTTGLVWGLSTKIFQANTYLGVRYELAKSEISFNYETFVENGIRYLVERTTRVVSKNSLLLKFGHRYRKRRFIVDSNVGLGYGLRSVDYEDNINRTITIEEQECEWFSCEDNLEQGKRGVFTFHLGVRFGFYLNKPKYENRE